MDRGLPHHLEDLVGDNVISSIQELIEHSIGLLEAFPEDRIRDTLVQDGTHHFAMSLPDWIIDRQQSHAKFIHEVANKLEHQKVIDAPSFGASVLDSTSRNNLVKHYLQDLCCNLAISRPNFEASTGDELEGVRWQSLRLELSEWPQAIKVLPVVRHHRETIADESGQVSFDPWSRWYGKNNPRKGVLIPGDEDRWNTL